MPRQNSGPQPHILGIRLDSATFRAIEKRAADAKLKSVDWCRRVLTQALNYDPDLLILLREVVATRRETRALVKELIQRGELSTERFNFLVTETEEKKEGLAQKVLEQARRSANRLPPTGEEKR
ncbi:MAG: hypothetical protein WAM39_00015 [Bryobacteraceae bacterium]